MGLGVKAGVIPSSLAAHPDTSHLTLLCLSFLICKEEWCPPPKAAEQTQRVGMRAECKACLACGQCSLRAQQLLSLSSSPSSSSTPGQKLHIPMEGVTSYFQD